MGPHTQMARSVGIVSVIFCSAFRCREASGALAPVRFLASLHRRRFAEARHVTPKARHVTSDFGSTVPYAQCLSRFFPLFLYFSLSLSFSLSRSFSLYPLLLLCSCTSARGHQAPPWTLAGEPRCRGTDPCSLALWPDVRSVACSWAQELALATAAGAGVWISVEVEMALRSLAAR